MAVWTMYFLRRNYYKLKMVSVLFMCKGEASSVGAALWKHKMSPMAFGEFRRELTSRLVPFTLWPRLPKSSMGAESERALLDNLEVSSSQLVSPRVCVWELQEGPSTPCPALQRVIYSWRGNFYIPSIPLAWRPLVSADFLLFLSFLSFST